MADMTAERVKELRGKLSQEISAPIMAWKINNKDITDLLALLDAQAAALRAEPAGLPAEPAQAEDERAMLKHFEDLAWKCWHDPIEACPKCAAIKSTLASFAALKQERDEWREKCAQLESACYDGCATGDNIFDELKRTIARAETAEAALAGKANRPKIVCFCGSIRFSAEMMIWAWDCAKRGIIVLTWHVLPDGYFKGTDDQNCVHGAEVEGVREIVDELHKRKIDLCDEVYVVNVGGYIGDSTKSEVRYARAHGKPLVWLEPDKAWRDE